MLAAVLLVMVSGFVTGGLARFAVPGPDPMPIWLTIAIGLSGSVVGGAIGLAIFPHSRTAVSLGGLIVAILLVVAYRRFVQHRPLTGPGAMAFPERGLGIGRQRARLDRLRQQFSPPAPAPRSATQEELLAKLNELHAAGVLSDEEYQHKREQVLEKP